MRGMIIQKTDIYVEGCWQIYELQIAQGKALTVVAPVAFV
jgi:hypothetical protein